MRRKPWELVRDTSVIKEKKPQLKDLRIHGQPCGSYNEWYVSRALEKLNLIYHYQEAFGLRAARGSQIIDFLVMQAPKPTPLFVHGEYWHRNRMGEDETLKISEINTRMRGYWNSCIIIWEHDCESEEIAYNTIKSIFI